jgi:hypothetical protein
MKKVLSLVALLTATQALLPCMTLGMMTLDDASIKTPTATNNSAASSEPSSPVDPAVLMPHSSAALLLRAYAVKQIQKKRAPKSANAA